MPATGTTATKPKSAERTQSRASSPKFSRRLKGGVLLRNGGHQRNETRIRDRQTGFCKTNPILRRYKGIRESSMTMTADTRGTKSLLAKRTQMAGHLTPASFPIPRELVDLLRQPDQDLRLSPRQLRPRQNRSNREHQMVRIHHAVSLFVFFHLTCLGFLIFRSESVVQAVGILQKIATPWPWWILAGHNTLIGTGLFALLAYALPLLVVQLVQHDKGDMNALLKMPAYARGLVYTALVYGLICYGVNRDNAFIYFQF